MEVQSAAGTPRLRRGLVRMLAALMSLVGAPLAALLLTATPGAAAGPGCPAGGFDFEVTTSSDAALRAAFTSANVAAAGPSTICIDSGLAPINLTGGELAYTQATNPGLSLIGNGITINANSSRVVHATHSGPVTLNGVNITGASSAGGSGVLAIGAVTVTNSTISNSHATAGGGGAVNTAGNVTITNSTLTGNTAPAGGGAVFTTANLTITNSTITGNSVSGPIDAAGGVVADGNVTLVYATVVQNTAPAAIAGNLKAGGTLTSFGSVVAQPRGASTLSCVVITTTSNGFNFSDDASSAVSCKFNAATDMVGASNDPMLGALGANGGPTNTMVPNPGSPLIDSIPGSSCPDGASGITTDQRSLPRPDSASPACDIGAVEVQPAPAGAPTMLMITPSFTG